MTDTNDKAPVAQSDWVAGGGVAGDLLVGLLGSISAFIGASCCVLPIILFNLGVGSAAIAQLGFFARFRDEFLVASIGLIALGTFWAFRGGKRPSKSAFIMLALAVVFAVAAYALPFYEPELLVLFGLRDT
mgnify:CR=1 FL=1